MELQSLAERVYQEFADGSTEVGGGSGGARTHAELWQVELVSCSWRKESQGMVSGLSIHLLK